MDKKLSSFGIAFQFRDDIRMIAEKVVNTLRPQRRFGVITGTAGAEVSPTATAVPVLINGEVSAVNIRCPGVIPFKVGDVVRVAGEPGDRFIEAVITPAHSQYSAARINTQEVQVLSGSELILDADQVQFLGTAAGEKAEVYSLHSTSWMTAPDDNGIDELIGPLNTSGTQAGTTCATSVYYRVTYDRNVEIWGSVTFTANPTWSGTTLVIQLDTTIPQASVPGSMRTWISGGLVTTSIPAQTLLLSNQRVEFIMPTAQLPATYTTWYFHGTYTLAKPTP